MALSDAEKKIRRIFREISAVQTETQVDSQIERVAAIIADALKCGNKILICGNGGSAAEALHFAGELVGRFKKERVALPAIVLGSNLASLTAVANDYDYESTFAREVEAYGSPGDVLVVMSTSGNSMNVVQAVQRAIQQRKIKTIGFLGGSGGLLERKVDLSLIVASTDTARIQEMHQIFVHIISELVEEILFGDGA